MMQQIYVLELEDGKYYVGKTDNLDARIQQHKKGYGAAWTKLHAFRRLVKIYDQTRDSDEHSETIEMMRHKGINNVRGGPFCQIELSEIDREVLQKVMNSVNGACYNCGQTDHMISQCSNKKKSVDHETKADDPAAANSIPKEPTQVTPNANAALQSSTGTGNVKTPTKSSTDSASMSCFRCGRTSHIVRSCYATWHADGSKIVDQESDDDDIASTNKPLPSIGNNAGNQAPSYPSFATRATARLATAQSPATWHPLSFGLSLSSSVSTTSATYASQQSSQTSTYHKNDQKKQKMSDASDSSTALPSASISCFRCGRTSHIVRSCYATWHADGSKIVDQESDSEDDIW